MRNLCFAFLLAFLWTGAYGQELYTARGYWEEQNKEAYQKIKQKQARGDSLIENEANYLQDFEAYLSNYFQRMSPQERETYERMKPEWDRVSAVPPTTAPTTEDFDIRGRDRVVNGFYGLYYGTSIAIVVDAGEAAAVGIPLLVTGVWLLGPAINAKKYEGINPSVIRASTTGRFLGVVNGGFLGLALGGNSEYPLKPTLGFSTLGSIVLGEVGFQMQKKNSYPEGKIEMIRHYGVMTPWLGASAVLAVESEDLQAYGAAMLAGGLAGLWIGSKVANRYNYTRGDVDAINSLAVITTGLGFTLVAGTLESGADGDGALFLIPAVATVAGTAWGQKMVRGVRLTTRQGSTINLAFAGAATMGLGILAVIGVDSPTALIAVPTILGLVAHQAMFSKYKKINLGDGVSGSLGKKHPVGLSFKIMPESYFINRKIPVERFTPEAYTQMINPLAKIRLTF